MVVIVIVIIIPKRLISLLLMHTPRVEFGIHGLSNMG